MTRFRTAALAIPAILLGAAVWDFSSSSEGNLCGFDPHEVARLETKMWRDYYEHRRAALFLGLATSLRTQFGLGLTGSWVTAFHAARAAVVFQKGRSRTEYEQALPDLRSYYESLLRKGARAEDAARLELEWWILHRERDRIPAGALEKALAALQARIYGIPAEVMDRHARLRAEAMLLRDHRAEAGGVSEEDWRQISELLDGSWSSLREAILPACPQPPR